MDSIDFIGIGAPKSGSTWLSKCLEEHPQILLSSKKTRKEVLFFNTDDIWGEHKTNRLSCYNRGFEWYLQQFPEPKVGYLRGEFSASYMADPVAYERIKEHLPNVKLVAILRNPVDMVYSSYWYFYHGTLLDVPESFSESLSKGMFIDKGFYYKHLKKFYDNFPADNIHVVIYDDTIKNPTSVTRDLYNFLGVDPSFIPPSIDKRINSAYETKSKLLKDIIHKCMVAIDRLELENIRMRILESRTLFNIYSTINKRPSQYPKMSVDDRKKCVEIFMDDINSLEKLLNRDFSSWKSVES
ncbi:MAG: Sulfotransferase [candidate division WWE3 bacterium GW2011_GWC1_41_7]|uniref:Sulfotransferase n=1 Tax=candidate division WWE3 bacterium GW2011_GWC1_41_7 TaxID=1619119 RepID=A0A0G0X7V2_UNCKA|nr:MAG: Sulfotransferase [candidate division WWE3 bacterium GW2011_GWC1_41_7]